MSPLATALMNSRIEHSMSRFRAAECAGVSERTWRYYEQGQRSPRKSVVRNFFDRSGISMPSNIAKLLKVARSARVLSITSLKGGVGKSPITVDVAACLVERGSNVAIITHDCCFEDDASNGKHPKAHSLAAGVDFFGYTDVFFSVAEKVVSPSDCDTSWIMDPPWIAADWNSKWVEHLVQWSKGSHPPECSRTSRLTMTMSCLTLISRSTSFARIQTWL